MDKSKNNFFSNNIDIIANDEKYYGRMNDPVCSAFVKGACRDEMEYYLVIENNIITDIKFWTTGCESSKACGITLAYCVINKNLYDALNISPNYIIERLKNLPEENRHCAILACMTFYKAVGEYLVNYNNY